MKKSIFALIFVFLIFPVFCDNWTLGVMEFSFRQTKSRSQSSSQAAQVLPQLIIEQFSNEALRTIPHKEQLDRKLKELQTARLALFLQLSKEYKTRDSLVLTEIKPKKLQKAIETQMKKIKDIELQIDENLENVQKAIEEAAPKIERDEQISEDKQKKESSEQNSAGQKEKTLFPFRLPFPFFQRDEDDKIVTENVVLYKSDSTALFKPSEKSLEAGFTSWDFEQEVVSAKINGLITGEITTYGDYCSVTANLRIYPGAKVLGTVTEVGLLSDLMPLAANIARNLDSKIVNALPVVLEFEIEPKGTDRLAKVTVDDVVFPLTKTDGTFENKIIEDSGVHRVKVESPGYEDLTFSYSFTGENHFFVHINLVPKVSGVAKIRLKKYRDGVFHTYGLNQSSVSEEEPVASVQVNSKTVLGVFSVPKKSGEDSDSGSNAFFMIPESSAFDGANLVVNAKPFDREKNIDKRRRWMYTAYTGLILSLPFTFYYKGEFTAENIAYSQGRADYDRLVSLRDKANICEGISIAFGVWSAVELVRYLWAADRVLPTKAKIDKNPVDSCTKMTNEPQKTETEVMTENDTEVLESGEIDVNPEI